MAWLDNVQMQNVLKKIYDGTVHLDNDGKKISTNETKATNTLFNKYKTKEITENISYEQLDEYVKNEWEPGKSTHNGSRLNTVSYTHLTLPTIYSV